MSRGGGGRRAAYESAMLGRRDLPAGSTEHDIGEHASSQTEQRLGIGNVADLLTGSHQPGALGSLLGSLDNLDATACP